MDAYNRYTRCIFQWGRILLKIVGHDVLDSEFVRSWITYFVYGLIGFTIIVEIYNILYFDIMTKILCLHFVFMTIQVGVHAKTNI